MNNTPDVTLTGMEYEVLLGVCDGLSTEMVARQLSVSTDTVGWRRTTLYKKLGAHSAYEAVRKAWQQSMLKTCPVCQRYRDGSSALQGFMFPNHINKNLDKGVMAAERDDYQSHTPDFVRDDLMPSGRPRLTDRRAQILRLMAVGATDEEIGRELFITYNTVRTHRMKIFELLGVHTRGAAVAIGFVDGYITRDYVLKQLLRRGKLE